MAASVSLGRFDRRIFLRSAAVVAGLAVYYAFDWIALQRVWQTVFAASLAAIGHQASALGADSIPYLVVDSRKFLLSRNCTYVDFALVLTPLLWQPRAPLESNLRRLATVGIMLALFNWWRVVFAIHMNVTRGLSWQSVHFWPDFLLHIGVIVAASLHALWADWTEASVDAHAIAAHPAVRPSLEA